jgi:hypothetical protein
MMVASVPTWKTSSKAGSLVLAFFCAARTTILSLPMASSRAAMDFSRPTNSGTTMWGKTMMSRSGRSGRVWLGKVASEPPFYHRSSGRTGFSPTWNV